MSNASINGANFTEQAEKIILEHLSNEQFGVSELAEAMNISRSNLLRKIKKQTQLSASQFIRQVRLKKSMQMLRETAMTVSEISYEVGFSSPSYYIKCFREHYGHPPGKVAKGEWKEETIEFTPKPFAWKPIVVVLLVVALLYSVVFMTSSTSKVELEKSIAVLPFKNESNDSSNIYFINGLMESTLTNLQKIKDLRVISRTSVEKYRDTDRLIPEIAEELQVNYFVEGSGQRIGDQVLLNIQLIEASSDRHIWAEQYNRKVDDVFALQNEIAQKIVAAIEVIVTPAELAQIEKRPTESLVAYELFLRALPYFHTRTKEGLEKAIEFLEQAVVLDPQFALAHANIAIAYYFLEEYVKERQYHHLINSYADKALLYDSKSAESLIAKALFYIHTQEYYLALPHLEKALEYNPNSAIAVQMLIDFYSRHVPNTAKNLEYALKGVQLNIAGHDSIARSYSYLNLSSALVQCGFVDEAALYIAKAMDYNQENYYAPQLRAFIQYAQDRDTKRAQELLLKEWKKDPTRLDLIQEVAKMFYLQENQDSAFHYYEQFVKLKQDQGLYLYPNEDIKIAYVYQNIGLQQQAADFFSTYVAFSEGDQSIYKNVWLAMQYAYEGKIEQGIEQLQIFSNQDNIQYWFLMLEDDPVLKPLKDHPAFPQIIQILKNRFWENHEKLRISLVEKGLI